MPIQFKGNSRTVFTVKPYDECLAFYKDVLNLEIVNQWDKSTTDKGVVYMLGQIEFELLKGDTTSPSSDNMYTYIQVEDVDGLYERIQGKADIVKPIANQAWGHRNFMIKDPAGIHLKFFSLLEQS